MSVVLPGGVVKLAHVWLSGAQVLGTKNVPTHVPRETCRDSMLSVLFCWRILESPEKVAHVNDFWSCGACGGSSSQHYPALSMAASVSLEEIVTAARRYMSFASHHALRHGPYRLVVRTSRCGRDNPGSTPGGYICIMREWQRLA